MFYGQSAPWPLKIGIFGAATLAGHGAAPDAPAPEAPDAALRACFGALVLFTVASVLPSLVYSVRSRRETTTFVTQSALMLAACGAFVEYLRAADAGTRAYASVSMLVVATHYLYMVFRALTRAPKLLLYSSAVGAGAIALAVVVFGALVPRLPAFHMHGVVALCLMFAGEVLGLGVFLLDAVLRAVADGAEQALAA